MPRRKECYFIKANNTDSPPTLQIGHNFVFSFIVTIPPKMDQYGRVINIEIYN